MQLTCPQCSERVPAENINIQEMVAVCPACDTIFQFDSPTAKAKRRKVKRPEQLSIEDGNRLHMAFRTNWRLDRSEAFLGSVFGSVFMSVFAILIGSELGPNGPPLLIPLTFALVALVLFYNVALTVYNKTHIEMDNEKIQVSRKPLRGVFNHVNTIDLSGVVGIRCEETAISKKEDYDTPRFSVWADTVDGRQRLIVTDLVEDYGYFIAQRLEERLHAHDETEETLKAASTHRLEERYDHDTKVNAAYLEALDEQQLNGRQNGS